MKKTIAILTILAICIFSAFCGDITAVTSNGRTVVLHDNGTWEYMSEKTSSAKTGDKTYIGVWAFPEDFVDKLIDATIAEMGFAPGSSEYVYFKALYGQSLKAQMSDLTGISIEFKKDGTAIVKSDGEEESCKFSIDSETRLVYITAEGETEPFGTFNEDYTELYLMGIETVCMTKRY